MSSKEFGEWIAYENINPGNPEREDLRAAIISATIANTVRAKGKPFQPKDFMLDFDRDNNRRKSQKELLNKMKQTASIINKRADMKEKKNG